MDVRPGTCSIQAEVRVERGMDSFAWGKLCLTTAVLHVIPMDICMDVPSQRDGGAKTMTTYLRILCGSRRRSGSLRALPALALIGGICSDGASALALRGICRYITVSRGRVKDQVHLVFAISGP